MMLYAYTLYEYEKEPLLFLGLPYRLTNNQIIAILRCLETSYGDTCQETTAWTLEMELWLRMLLNGFGYPALVINPKHLEMTSDIVERISGILGHLTDKGARNAAEFRRCVNNKALIDAICQRLKEDPDAYEGIEVDDTNWPEFKIL